jgi:hypothetical protein
MQLTTELAQHRFFLLFLFLLGSLIYYPFAADSSTGYYVFRLLGAVVILLSVYAVSVRRSVVIIAVVLAIPALVERSQLLRADAGALPVLNTVLSFFFDLFVVVVIFRRVFANTTPDAETIFGALCIYLLVGFGFTSIYGIVATLEPAAFYLNPLTNLHSVPTRFDFVYYSFATMTALGPAGIVPVSPAARALSVIQAIIGVLYLAVLIARLMSTYRSRPHA